jgi:hypothetical protein
MTDRIDLDDVETEEPPEERPNRGDWFWRGEGDPEDEPAPDDERYENGQTAASAAADSNGGAGTASDRVPHVPRETKDLPVGIPKESGGAGAGPGEDGAGDGSGEGSAEGADADEQAASGPHGGDADDMTLALTYRAAKRLSEPAYAFSDASAWSDWMGIVGDVPAHAITKFQREHSVDADFFNGTGTGPRERLADVGPRSMFYAERFVLVGCEGEAGWAPDDWEFLPVEEAAEKAGWDLE